MKNFIPKSLLVLLLCATQGFLASNSSAESSVPGNFLDLKGSKAEESFALSSPARQPSQSEPSLLIGMVDRPAVYSEPSTTRASDVTSSEGTNNDDSRPVSASKFEEYNLNAFRRTPRYGFFSWKDAESLVRSPDFQARNRSSTLVSDANAENAEADVNTSSQPQTHFKPLAEIPLGNYRLPVFLGVRDAEHCCQ